MNFIGGVILVKNQQQRSNMKRLAHCTMHDMPRGGWNDFSNGVCSGFFQVVAKNFFPRVANSDEI